MKDFRFYCPVELVFGAGVIESLPEYTGCAKRALVVTGLSSAKKSGLLERVTKLLEGGGMEYVGAAAAEPNPSVATIEKRISRSVSRISCPRCWKPRAYGSPIPSRVEA